MLGQLGLYGPSGFDTCGVKVWKYRISYASNYFQSHVVETGIQKWTPFLLKISGKIYQTVLCRSRRLIKDNLLILVTFRDWKSFAICECFSRLTNVGKKITLNKQYLNKLSFNLFHFPPKNLKNLWKFLWLVKVNKTELTLIK